VRGAVLPNGPGRDSLSRVCRVVSAHVDARRRDLFSAAAERASMASGRPKSQELVELLHPEKAPDFGALWACICGADLGRDPRATCTGCGR
jgi:hypothetical protein